MMSSESSCELWPRVVARLRREAPSVDEQETRARAEGLCIELGIIPAGWTGFVVCVHCLLMPARPGIEGLLQGCPWCHTSEDARKRVKLEIDEELRAGEDRRFVELIQRVFPGCFSNDGEYLPPEERGF